MTRPTLILIFLILFTACNNKVNNAESILDKSKNVEQSQAGKDSVDIDFSPIYDSKTKSTSGSGPVFQTFLDSILKYEKIRQLIRDSSATIYILTKSNDGADTTKNSIKISIKNISIAICSFEKHACYLNFKFDYSKNSIIVLNSCKGQDSLSLYEWTKNCR